jgi:hypothetical protein
VSHKPGVWTPEFFATPKICTEFKLWFELALGDMSSERVIRKMSAYTVLNSVKIVRIEVQELAIENCVVP